MVLQLNSLFGLISDTKKQSVLPFKPVKKAMKRNPWSGSESESDDEGDIEVAPRKDAPRRQAAGRLRRSYKLEHAQGRYQVNFLTAYILF